MTSEYLSSQIEGYGAKELSLSAKVILTLVLILTGCSLGFYWGVFGVTLFLLLRSAICFFLVKRQDVNMPEKEIVTVDNMLCLPIGIFLWLLSLILPFWLDASIFVELLNKYPKAAFSSSIVEKLVPVIEVEILENGRMLNEDLFQAHSTRAQILGIWFAFCLVPVFIAVDSLRHAANVRWLINSGYGLDLSFSTKVLLIAPLAIYGFEEILPVMSIMERNSGFIMTVGMFPAFFSLFCILYSTSTFRIMEILKI